MAGLTRHGVSLGLDTLAGKKSGILYIFALKSIDMFTRLLFLAWYIKKVSTNNIIAIHVFKFYKQNVI